MMKVLRIALSEYKRRVVRKSFIIVLLLPLIIIAVGVIVGVVTVAVTGDTDKGVVGYVDPQNYLAKAEPPPAGANNSFKLFTDVATARSALEKQEIIAYYILAPDFLNTGNADFYYWKNEPGKSVLNAFSRFARSALVDGRDPVITQRILGGSRFTYQTPDGARTFDQDNVINIIFPIVVAIMFIIALVGGSSYLLQAVVDEKENRTIEIVVTSVTPMQLMSGKIVGLAAVGLTQIGIWSLAGSVAIFVLKNRVPFLQNASIEPAFILLAIVLSVLEYLMFGAIMAAIGSIVVDQKQGQSFSTPFTLLAMVPYFFIAVIIFDPNGTIALILSLFPLTAPLTILLRYGMANVPFWQIALSITLLVLTVIGAMWLAARIFRVGMLRFGQRVSISEIASSIRF